MVIKDDNDYDALYILLNSSSDNENLKQAVKDIMISFIEMERDVGQYVQALKYVKTVVSEVFLLCATNHFCFRCSFGP